MKLDDFDFQLPQGLIAQEQVTPRDHSRLMRLDRRTGEISHNFFYDLPIFLKPGDLLVVNNSKVYPARLIGQRHDTGGKVEIFLHKQLSDSTWEAIGKNLKPGIKIIFSSSEMTATIIKKLDAEVVVAFDLTGEQFYSELDKIGLTPLPPYIKRDARSKEKDNIDKYNYQTVYAKSRGSVAAPTAGLHFTDEVLARIRNTGVNFAEITLHVGLGTFSPVKVTDFTKHKMHSESYSVAKSTYDLIKKTKLEKGRVIAVGTTTTRVLEHIWRQPNPELFGETDIFIYPGFNFKCIDGLITNFHLPKSTLFMLVSAFAGQDDIKLAYKEAIEKEYRFFSYGDSMLII